MAGSQLVIPAVVPIGVDRSWNPRYRERNRSMYIGLGTVLLVIIIILIIMLLRGRA